MIKNVKQIVGFLYGYFTVSEANFCFFRIISSKTVNYFYENMKDAKFFTTKSRVRLSMRKFSISPGIP